MQSAWGVGLQHMDIGETQFSPQHPWKKTILHQVKMGKTHSRHPLLCTNYPVAEINYKKDLRCFIQPLLLLPGRLTILSLVF